MVNELVAPPGHRLLRFADFAFSRRNYSLVLEPVALAEEAHREAFGVLRSALRLMYPELGGGLPTAQQLGYTLRSLSGREVGGRRIVQAKKNTRGVSWAVRKTRAS